MQKGSLLIVKNNQDKLYDKGCETIRSIANTVVFYQH